MAIIIIDGNSFEDVELVLFDKDGTIIDIHHYWKSMIKIRSSLIVKRWFQDHNKKNNIENELIEAMGVDQKTGRMKPEGPVGIKPRPFIVDVASKLVQHYGASISSDDMENLFKEVDQLTSQEMLPLLKLLPGVVNLLESLNKCKIPTAIVSTDITSRAYAAMKTLELEHLFNEIIGGDAVINTKPQPDLALNVIDKIKCNPDRTVVIGDHPVDIKMGESAGVGLNIGVLTGLSDSDLFEGLKCVVVPDLNSIEVKC